MGKPNNNLQQNSLKQNHSKKINITIILLLLLLLLCVLINITAIIVGLTIKKSKDSNDKQAILDNQNTISLSTQKAQKESVQYETKITVNVDSEKETEKITKKKNVKVSEIIPSEEKNNEGTDSIIIENNSLPQNISNFCYHLLSIDASSQDADETYRSGTYNYSPWNMVDRDESTCWEEGVECNGIGENVTFTFDNIYKINGITISNRLCTNEDLFSKNSRIHDISISMLDNKYFNFSFDDGWENRKKTFIFPESVQTSFITITVDSVYSGWKYQDTCISEVDIF